MTDPASIRSAATKAGTTALITGASDGIGRATALALAAKGHDLVLAARNSQQLDALSLELHQRYGVLVRTLSADLTTPAGNGALANLILETRPQIAVLAAGYGSCGDFLSLDPHSEAQMIDLNCRAVLTQTQVLAAQMSERGDGHIVLFGSLVGFQGCAYSANYAATKAYIQALAEGLALELKPRGITVLSVAPGPVNTGFAARARMTMGAAATPDEVAKSIVSKLKKSGTVRPGLLAKTLGYGLSTLPRSIRVRIMSSIMAKMAAPSG
jgi:short-subunit dehydrogenase